MAKPYRRRNFLINKRFQLRFSLFVSSWILALSAIFPFLLYDAYVQFLDYVKLDPLGPEIEEVTARRTDMMFNLLATEAVFILLIAFISVFVSHKIAGPIFKTVRTLRTAGDAGDLKSPLFFRKGDHFPELAEAYNYFTGKISDRAGQARAHIERALQGASEQQKKDLQQALSSLQGL
jgi:methyl-accepting chemotaxis protein